MLHAGSHMPYYPQGDDFPTDEVLAGYAYGPFTYVDPTIVRQCRSTEENATVRKTFDACKWRRCGQYVERVLAPLQRGKFFNTTLISVHCITAGFATLL
jgi:hypothetical protein